MKKFSVSLVLFCLCVTGVATATTENPLQKAVGEFIRNAPQKPPYYTIGLPQDTASPFAVVPVYVSQQAQGPKFPIAMAVSKDGKTIVPNANMVFFEGKPIFTKQLDPDFGSIDFKPVAKDRIVYNPAGVKTVFMFSDPDCPYCEKVLDRLKTYSGPYKVVVKHYPLIDIHPKAMQESVDEQADWLVKTEHLDTKSAREKAEKIVNEDIAEGKKAGIPGTPFYVLSDGKLLPTLF